METMTCPHCRNEIPRKGSGKHLLECSPIAAEAEFFEQRNPHYYCGTGSSRECPTDEH